MSLTSFLKKESNFINVDKTDNKIDFYISDSIIPDKRKGWSSKMLSRSSIILAEEEKIDEFNLRLPPVEDYNGDLKKDVKQAVSQSCDLPIRIEITNDPGGSKTPHLRWPPTSRHNQTLEDKEFADFVTSLVEYIFNNIY